jgi:opacity protein-like surface antigen
MQAESDRAGPYVRVDAGLGFLADTAVERTNALGSTSQGDGAFSPGWLTGAALGYRFDDRWSADVEFTYRTNDIDELSASGAGGLAAREGDFASAALMVNGRYHFESEGALRPFVGLGLGVIEEIDIDLELGGAENSYSDSGFGIQAMLGLDYQFADSWSLSGELRYFRAFDFEGTGEGLSAGGTARADYDHLGLLLGLTYRF